MHEMLGNQYFMARNYLGAATVFQNVLSENPTNINARKKLIISYTQIGKYSKALDLFCDFIGENIEEIISTDPVKDDCPCPELVQNLEIIHKTGNESFTTFHTLGILWLYCDIRKSIEYFEKALNLRPQDEKVNTILVILKKKFSDLSQSEENINPSL